MAGSNKSNALDISQWLPYIRQIPIVGSQIGQAFEYVVNGINQGHASAAVSGAGVLESPPKINSFQVSGDAGGFAHFKITDNGNIQRGIHYFVEHADNAAFTNAHVIDLGASRNGVPLYIGNSTRYFRAYSHYQGANQSSTPVNHGGAVPAAVTGSGSSPAGFLTSSGAGTSPTDGSRPGQGLGPVLYRGPMPTSKRNITL